MRTSKSATRTPGDVFIARRKTIDDWRAFQTTLVPGGDAALWEEAFEDYFQARLSSRYLEPLTVLQKNGAKRGEGFSIVAIQCSLIEFLESTVQGKSYRLRKGAPRLGQYEYSNSSDMFQSFLLNRTPFNGEFTPATAQDFYEGVRCGLLHEARTKNGWTILAKNKTGRVIDEKLKIVYRDTFQAALLAFVRWYKGQLTSDVGLQEAFIRKFDSLCL